jgi:two-component system phosphate regulon sensor histidine kinase PhoR
LRISQLDRKENILKKSFCDVHDIIEKSVSHLTLLFKASNADVKYNFKAIESNFNLSKESFINVFVNLLENAIKYSNDKPKINISTYNLDNNLIVSINDNGIGMTSNVKDKIFKKFYRESKGNVHNVKGHGLGLSYVKKIIDLHGGTISVESDIGLGSTFKIMFPVNT